MRTILKTVIIAILLTSCAANKDSRFRKNEEVVMNMIPADGGVSGLTEGQDVKSLGLSGVALAVANTVVKLGVNQIGKQLKKEAQQYEAKYFASVVQSDFYEEVAKDNTFKFNYAGFEIIRKAGSKKSDYNGEKETVATLKFQFENAENGSDNYFYRLKPVSVLVNKTKAKLRAKDQTVDLVVDISIYGYWVNKGVEYHSQKVAETSFPIKNVKLGEEKINFGNLTSDWLMAVPISTDKDNKYVGTGNFKIMVEVSEVDDFGEKVNKVATFVNDNSDQAIEIIQGQLGSEEEGN